MDGVKPLDKIYREKLFSFSDKKNLMEKSPDRKKKNKKKKSE